MGLAKRQANNSATKRTKMMMVAIINPTMLKKNGLVKFTVEIVVPREQMRRMISVEKHKTPTVSALNARFLWPYQAEIATRVIAKAENVSQTLSGASIAAENCRISSSLLVIRSRMLPENWCTSQNRWIDAIVGRERVAMRSLVIVSFLLPRKFAVQ